MGLLLCLRPANPLPQGPLLLGAPVSAADADFDKTESWHRLPRHRDEDQVRLDVDRSFIYYPNGICDRQALAGEPSRVRC